ncbi:unnamed protein product [Angiostrongylus costaricensis]|uniref:Uncharacterized protein n=1 Tax=Angiostrongylus costaricensis TaxID=334426 RepID=A0A158PJL2_ANGCS|nr:unnamed protein product [Angiostrongylus costaricensis]
MSLVNDYLMFRLLMEQDEQRKGQRRTSLRPQSRRDSLLTPRVSISEEPFCSPIVPHIPIRQRLSSRRCTSVDIVDVAPVVGQFACQVYGQGRRRRMSLLQTLRQQNRQLNDSGLEIHRQRTDSEIPINMLLLLRLFGKREKRLESSFHTSDEHSQSFDGIGGRSGKSPSTTNDSGRGSQQHLDQDRVVGEIVAIIERPNDENEDVVKPYRRIRTSMW